MNKLKQLLNRCKCGVFITVNEHRDVYETAAQFLEQRDGWECPPEIEPDVRAKMIELNTVIEIHLYPDTPIGSYTIYHHDIDAALSDALECLKEKP